MRKTQIPHVITTLITLLLLMLATNAYAISNGIRDQNEHPYVGLIVFEDANGPAWLGTGSLLSPNIVLTAGHLTEGAVAARIWFDENLLANTEFPDSGYTSYEAAQILTMPHSPETPGLTGFAQYDIGIVILAEPVPTDVVSEYAELPNPNQINGLPLNSQVTLVGYGVQWQERGFGITPPTSWRGAGMRMQAAAQIVPSKDAIGDKFLKVTANLGQGRGGTCFGDSGGPVLLEGTKTILAVTSFGTNYNCAGIGYYSRVDIPEAQQWISTYFP